MRDVTRCVWTVHHTSGRPVVTFLVTTWYHRHTTYHWQRQLSCRGQELRHSVIRIQQSEDSYVIYKLKPSFGSASTKDCDTQCFSTRLRSRMALQVFSHCKLFPHFSTVRSASVPLCGKSSGPEAGFLLFRYSLMKYWLDKVSALLIVTGITE